MKRKKPEHSSFDEQTNKTFVLEQKWYIYILQIKHYRHPPMQHPRGNEKVKGNLAAVQRQRSASYYISALQ